MSKRERYLGKRRERERVRGNGERDGKRGGMSVYKTDILKGKGEKGGEKEREGSGCIEK